MSFPSFARTLLRLLLPSTVGVGAFALAMIPACGKSNASGPSAICPETAPSPDETPANGTVEGAGLSAQFCGIEIGINGFGSGPGLYPLAFESSPSATMTVEAPAGGVNASVSGFVDLSAPAPGVYKSSDATLCGGLTFSYGIPVHSANECILDGGFGCPAGCAFTYTCPNPAGYGNGCCVPVATTYIYQASTGSGQGCASAGQPSLGSWTVTLTSATAEDAGYGAGGYIPYIMHGTLNATLVGTTGKTDSVNLSFSF